LQNPAHDGGPVARAEPGFLVELDGSEAWITLFSRDALLVLAEAPDAAAVLLGRLTYRDELASRSGADPSADDAQLLLAAYRREGATALERLEGDFAAVVVDRRTGRIEASRDPMGGYPLYWKETADGAALATSLRLLPDAVALAPDPDFISETLSLAVGEIDYFPGTAFRGVARLRGGERLTMTAGTRGAGLSRFWNWAEQVEQPVSSQLEDVAAEYRERLARAVRERLHGRVAAHVSGGMDSSAVALLAAPLMAERGSPLIGVSMVYDEVENLRVERTFIDQVYAAQPGIEAHRLRADDHLDFDGFATCPPHEEPYSGLFRIGLSRAGIEAAAGAGAQTLLTGFGADEVLSNAPFYIADLLRSGHIPEAWREASRWSRARSTTIWRYLWPFGVAPLLPSGLLSGWRSWLKRGYADWEHQDQSTIAPFIGRAFAHDTGLRNRMLAHVQANYRTQPSIVLSEALARLRSTSGDWMRQTLARPLGLHVSHPFRDPRVMRLGLGARLAVRPDPGQQKPVLSAAMHGIIPEPILRRRSKTHFNAVYFKGLARNLPVLDALTTDAASDPLGVFDRAELRRCLHRAALGVASVDAMVGLNNALATLRWFSLLPDWRKAAPRSARMVTLRLGAD
jgi:asparagine synthase (glutamine-hydrolysing)